MTTIQGLSSKKLGELQTEAYDNFAHWMSLGMSDSFKRKKKISETLETVSAIQLELLHSAARGSVQNQLAVYGNAKDFSDFNIEEFGVISQFRSTLLLSLAARDKNGEEHRMFFDWMRDRLDIVGLCNFYQNGGLIALGGYIKTLSGILSTFLSAQLGDDMAEEWDKDEDEYSVSKEQLEWLLKQFIFLGEIKIHDLDPFEVVAEKASLEIPQFKNIIQKGHWMARLMLRRFESDE